MNLRATLLLAVIALAATPVLAHPKVVGSIPAAGATVASPKAISLTFSERLFEIAAVDSLEEAVELSHLLAGRDDVILCFGSLSYLGRILKLMEKRQTAGNKRKAKR